MIPENISNILQCPDCAGKIEGGGEEHGCSRCMRSFDLTEDGILRMMPKESKPRPEMYADPEYLRWQEYEAEALEDFWEKKSLAFTLIHDSAHRRAAQWNREASDPGWILDIGCGSGYHYRYHKNLGNVIGIDSNIESLHRIKGRFPKAILIQADCCNLPLRDGLAATVLAIHSLEHIYYLDDALLEIRRIMLHSGRFFAGLPCEGGFAWNLGRKFTSERILSKKYEIDYKKVVAIEHCNTAKEVLESLKKYFGIDRLVFFPFRFLPLISANLTLTLQLSTRK